LRLAIRAGALDENYAVEHFAKRLRAGGMTDAEQTAREQLGLSTEKEPPRLKLNALLGMKRTQADILIACAADADLFHSPADEACAWIEINGHRENHRIGSKLFTRWLQHRYFEMTGGAPNSESLRTALKQLEARAFFDGERHSVHLRIAEHNANIYVDLCDGDWRAVEITPFGWEIIAEPPVRFVRAKGMLPLPEPEQGGNLMELRQFIRTKNKSDFVLIIAWLLGAFRADGPFPLLSLFGESGSAKSTTAEILREIGDPSLAPLRTLPRDERDLFIMAKNSSGLIHSGDSQILRSSSFLRNEIRDHRDCYAR